MNNVKQSYILAVEVDVEIPSPDVITKQIKGHADEFCERKYSQIATYSDISYAFSAVHGL